MREVKWNKRMAKHCIVTLTNPFDSLKQPAKGSLNQTIYGGSTGSPQGELGRTMNEQLKALIASRGNGSTGSPQDGSTPLTTSGEKP